MNIRSTMRILLITFALSNATPTHSSEGNNTFIHGAIGTAVIAALGYAIYWYNLQSDEDICSEAHYIMMGHKGDYTQIIQVAEDHLKLRSISLHDAHQYAQNIDEDTLYALAVAKHKKEPIAVYHAQLNSGMNKLQLYYDDLHDRIQKQKDVDLRNTMSVTADNLKNLIAGLSLLDRIFFHHKSYFTLYESEAKTGVKYAEEFKVMAEHVANLFAQEDAVRRYVTTRSSTSNLPFPRVEYVNRIERDIKNLERVIASAVVGYPARIGSTQNYLETLKTIKSYIITDQHYAQEMVLYQQDQRERERLRLEKERINNERRKAERNEQLEREKIDAKNREVRAQERAAQAQEEANRIAKEKNNRPQEPQTVHVVHH